MTFYHDGNNECKYRRMGRVIDVPFLGLFRFLKAWTCRYAVTSHLRSNDMEDAWIDGQEAVSKESSTGVLDQCGGR